MALRLWKRKKPLREDKMLKDTNKYSERAFDDKTLETLQHFIHTRTFDTLDFPVQHGKEAAVYRATKDTGAGPVYLAVKIFKYEGPSFQKRLAYLQGDRRFKAPKAVRALVDVFARKEYANLKMCHEAGIRVPEPIANKHNVVIMEFLGEGGIPSALLKDVWLEDPAATLLLLLDDMKKMHAAGLAHADLSEYNIIVHKGEPYIIDMGQSVVLSHPSSEEFFIKDVHNVLKWFDKLGAHYGEKEAIAFILSGGKKSKKSI
ncbi:MAG: RIO1 family regulatory kinase/ATPase [Candidatus Micrarchaeota archaeon]